MSPYAFGFGGVAPLQPVALEKKEDPSPNSWVARPMTAQQGVGRLGGRALLALAEAQEYREPIDRTLNRSCTVIDTKSTQDTPRGKEKAEKVSLQGLGRSAGRAMMAELAQESADHTFTDTNSTLDTPRGAEKAEGLSQGVGRSAGRTMVANLIQEQRGRPYIDSILSKNYAVTDTKSQPDISIGTEEVERISTADMFSDMYNQRLRLIESGHIVDPQGTVKESTDQRLAAIAFTQERDRREAPDKANWVDSFGFRYALGDGTKNDRTFTQAVNSYYPAPVNFRYHSFVNASQTEISGGVRCGALTDLSNGFTNLEELRAMRANSNLYNKKKSEIQQLINQNHNASTIVRESLAYIKDELDHLDATIDKRSLILQDQMLALLYVQLRKKASSFEGDTFRMSHVSLLNRKTQKVDDSGWLHYENNAMLDMATIFNDFHNKTIVFDSEIDSPYLHKDGTIHMPQMGEKQDSIKLQTFFFNVSPQGHTKNDKEQERVNLSNMHKLAESLSLEDANGLKIFGANSRVPKEMREFEKMCAKGESSYTVADNLIAALGELCDAQGVSCASAKDRTGAVYASTVAHAVEASLNTLGVDKKLKKKYMTKVDSERISAGSIASKIVAENTKAIYAKVAGRLPGETKTHYMRHLVSLGGERAQGTETLGRAKKSPRTTSG